MAHGLSNEAGENNCFLNAGVQVGVGRMCECGPRRRDKRGEEPSLLTRASLPKTLFHLLPFKRALLATEDHVCTDKGDASCSFCALKVSTTGRDEGNHKSHQPTLSTDLVAALVSGCGAAGVPGQSPSSPLTASSASLSADPLHAAGF